MDYAEYDVKHCYFDLLCRLLAHMLTLPIDSSLPSDYAVQFNKKVQVSFLFQRFFMLNLVG